MRRSLIETPETALAFLEAQRGWIMARLDALPTRVPFAEGAVVPVLGVPHRIFRESSPAAPPVAIGEGAEFLQRPVRLADQRLGRRCLLGAHNPHLGLARFLDHFGRDLRTPFVHRALHAKDQFPEGNEDGADRVHGWVSNG